MLSFNEDIRILLKGLSRKGQSGDRDRRHDEIINSLAASATNVTTT